MEYSINFIITTLCFSMVPIAFYIGTNEGMLLDFYLNFLRKHVKGKLYKVLGGCLFCYGFWVTLILGYIYYSNIIGAFITACLAELFFYIFLTIDSLLDSQEKAMEVKFYTETDLCRPIKATTGSTGYDLKAYINEPITINPRQTAIIPTGVRCVIDDRLDMQIRSRSGLAYKHGVVVLQGIGTIDSDYEGELIVMLINLSNKKYTIEPYDRIAQITFNLKADVSISFEDSMSWVSNNTERGEGGFGSTGK